MRSVTFLTLLLAALGNAVPLREIVVWLDARHVSNNTWSSWTSTLASHRSNVTGAAPIAYYISDTGVFRTLLPNASSVATAEYWMREMRTSAALHVKPLVLASAAGIALATTVPSVGRALIAATTQEAERLGLSGFDLRLDAPGAPTLRTSWLPFVGSWLDSFNAAGVQLGLLIPGNCTPGQPPQWFGASCTDLHALALNATYPHPNLRVISEASFGSAPPSAWTAGSNAALHGLGPSVVSLGVTYAPPLQDPENGCLLYALAGGITSLYVNEGLPPEGPDGAQDWSSFGYWMTTIV